MSNEGDPRMSVDTSAEGVAKAPLPTNARDLELLALAEAARQLTSDSWAVVRYGDGDSLVIHYDDDNRVCFMATPGRNAEADLARIQTTAAFIVACQPSAVLALLARTQRAESERDAARALNAAMSDRCTAYAAERDAERAARQRAEADAARLREALLRYEAAKDGISADSYDGIEPRYALMLQEASAAARAALGGTGNE